MKKIKTASVLAAVSCLCALFTGCGEQNGNNEETPVNSDNTSYTTADVQSLLDAAEDGETSSETSAPANGGETDSSAVSFSTVTDVENEVDRAIYKTSLTLPDGWQTVEDSKNGKIYSSAHSQLKIQAMNYGADAEVRPIDEFADSVAANIVYNNMYLRADTEMGEPSHTAVAGNDAVRYDYTVSAYFFERDDQGNAVGEKQLFATYPGRLYIFYNVHDGLTDGYMLQFETESDHIDEANKDFDAIIESFEILDDGTEGYASASVYMSEYEEHSLSAEQSALDSMAEDYRTASETSE